MNLPDSSFLISFASTVAHKGGPLTGRPIGRGGNEPQVVISNLSPFTRAEICEFWVILDKEVEDLNWNVWSFWFEFLVR